MKRMIIYLVSGLLVLIAAVFITASFQSNNFRLERSMTTNASASQAFVVLSDLHRFSEWSPWAKLDPQMKIEFAGAAAGPGSLYSWDGNDKVGSGRMTITEVQADKEVTVKLEFMRPFPSTNKTIWKIEDEGAQRRVTWIMEGTYESIVPKVFGLVMNMDKIVGNQFAEGLSALKVILETNQPS